MSRLSMRAGERRGKTSRLTAIAGIVVLFTTAAVVYAIFRSGDPLGQPRDVTESAPPETREASTARRPTEVATAGQEALRNSSGSADDATELSPSERFEAYVASLASDPDQLFLPDAERNYLWKTEQCAFELERHVFPALAQALRDGDRSAWHRALHPDFSGTVPAEADKSADRSFVRVRRWDAVDTSGREVDGLSLTDFLFTLRARFESLSAMAIRVPRLSPVARGNIDGPWQAQLKFEMRGAMSGGELYEVVLMGDAVFDRLSVTTRDDEHWFQGLHFSQMNWSRGPSALLKDVARLRGLDPDRFHDNWTPNIETRKVVTGGIFLEDYDQDGWLDVLVTDLRGNALFRGNPDGQFQDVTRASGLGDFGPGGVAAFTDLDNDGDPDLVAASDGKLAFYQNLGNGRFRLVRETRPPRSIVSITVADYDGDGWIDLFFPGDAPVPFAERGPNVSLPSYIDDRTGRDNVLFRNRGGWRFENVTKVANVAGHGGSDFTALWFDANSDGHPDVLTVNELGINFLGWNEGDGTFRADNIEGDNAPAFSMGGSTGDFDNDGRIDVYVSNMYSKAGSRVIGNVNGSHYPPGHFEKIQAWVAGNSLYRNLGQGGFKNVGRELQVHDVGFAYGSSFVDFDNDGWLDLYALAGFHSVSRTEPDG